MKQKHWQSLLALGLILLPLPALADFYEVSNTDHSKFFLGILFGRVGDILMPSAAYPVFPHLFRIFNITVLTLGVFMLTYTTIFSIANTAQEGEVMGKKWSSVWIPLRAASGLALLIPSGAGYCLAQVMMMWVVVQGIGAANSLWDVILDNYAKGYSLSAPTPQFGGVTDATKKIWRVAVCSAQMNNNPRILGNVPDVKVGPYREGNTMYFGIPKDQRGKAPRHIRKYLVRPCGSIKLNDLGENHEDFYIQQEAAFSELFYFYERGATQASSHDRVFEDIKPEPPKFQGLGIPTPKQSPGVERRETYWTERYLLSQGKIILKSSFERIRFNSQPKREGNVGKIADKAKRDGWMYAGAFYSTLVSNQSALDSFTVPNVNTAFKFPKKFRKKIKNKRIGSHIQHRQRHYMFFTEGREPNEQGFIKIGRKDKDPPLNFGKEKRSESMGSTGSRASGGPGVVKLLIGPVSNAMIKTFMSFLTDNARIGHEGKKSDPLISLGRTGIFMINLMETTLVYTIISIFGLMLISWGSPGWVPSGHAFNAALKMALPMVLFMFSLMYAACVMIGIYLPLLPYFLFTFGVLAWFILVIEAMTAAPIIALGLSAPGQETLGKAQHALMIVLNLFLRPALMILGFVLSARLVIAIIEMFNFAFLSVLHSQVSTNPGFFMAVAIMVLYGGIVQSLVQEAFSLIHILPDKVIRWIGGPTESSGQRIEGMVQQVEQQAQQGAKMSAELGQAAGKAAGEAIQKLDETKKKGEEMAAKVAAVALGIPPQLAEAAVQAKNGDTDKAVQTGMKAAIQAGGAAAGAPPEATAAATAAPDAGAAAGGTTSAPPANGLAGSSGDGGGGDSSTQTQVINIVNNSGESSA